MIFQSWLDSVNGKFIDVDGNHKFWCVDLMRAYLRDYLGLSPWYMKPVMYAKDIFYNFPNNDKKFKKIVNMSFVGYVLAPIKMEATSQVNCKLIVRFVKRTPKNIFKIDLIFSPLI